MAEEMEEEQQQESGSRPAPCVCWYSLLGKCGSILMLKDSESIKPIESRERSLAQICESSVTFEHACVSSLLAQFSPAVLEASAKPALTSRLQWDTPTSMF